MIISNTPNQNSGENPEDSEETKSFLEKFEILNKHFHKAAEGILHDYEDLQVDIFNTANVLEQLEDHKNKLINCIERYETESFVSRRMHAKFVKSVEMARISDNPVEFSFITYERFLKNELIEIEAVIQETRDDILERNMIFQIFVKSFSEKGDYHIDHATRRLASIVKKMCKNYFQSNLLEDPGLHKDQNLLDEDGYKVAFIESEEYACRLITLVPIFPKPIYRHPNAGKNGGATPQEN